MERLAIGRKEMYENLPYHVGDKIKMDIPLAIGRGEKHFSIIGVNPYYITLSDGIINVCFDLATIYYLKKGEVLRGEWT